MYRAYEVYRPNWLGDGDLGEASTLREARLLATREGDTIARVYRVKIGPWYIEASRHVETATTTTEED